MRIYSIGERNINQMRIVAIASAVLASLALNAETLQGKVVRVADGDTITILDEAKVEKVGLWRDAKPIASWDFIKQEVR